METKKKKKKKEAIGNLKLKKIVAGMKFYQMDSTVDLKQQKNH